MFRTTHLTLLLALAPLAVAVTAPTATAQPTSKVVSKVYACDMSVQVGPNSATVTKVEDPGYGKLGDIQFEVGDVIYEIGGVGVAPGVSLDTLINKAVAAGKRTVKVRDKNSGQVISLTF